MRANSSSRLFSVSERKNFIVLCGESRWQLLSQTHNTVFQYENKKPIQFREKQECSQIEILNGEEGELNSELTLYDTMSVHSTWRIAFAPTKTTRWLFLLLCTLFHLSDATIRIVGDGTEFLSRPDNYVGLQFKAGTEYAARIQRVHGDDHLCGGNRMHVHAPDDGRPGTSIGLCDWIANL